MSENTQKKSGLFYSFIHAVEVAGNKIPDPFFLFSILAVIVLALSCLLGYMGTSVTYMAQNKAGAMANVTVTVKNLLTVPYFQKTLSSFVNIYVRFSPLGLVMVMMIAVGFLQETGYFNVLMKKTLMNAPAFVVTFALGVVGVCANIASNGGIIFAGTIGAALFAAMGRNPIIGAVAGYCAGHGGFGANLIINGTDTLLGGITEAAAKSMNIPFNNNPMVNYTYLFVATLVLGLCVTVVTEWVLPRYVSLGWDSTREVSEEEKKLTPAETRGLRASGAAFLVMTAILLAMTVPASGWLRNAKGGILPKSPFTDGLVFILFVYFVVLGIVYGKASGVITKNNQIPKLMEKGLRGSLSFLIVALPAALFIQFFNDSKLATILAVNGGNFLKSMNLSGIPLALMFILLVAFLNMFMTSGSAKWLILAPVFVPMFSVVGFSPAFSQLIYRIGDSVTNPISPVNFFLPVIIGIMEQYKGKNDPEIKIGTLFSMTIPYSIAFFIGFVALLVIFMVFNLQIGPGATIYM